jgi:hypothetical protein
MIDADTIQRVRTASAAISHAVDMVDVLRAFEPEASNGNPKSRRYQLTRIARDLETKRGALERLYE